MKAFFKGLVSIILVIVLVPVGINAWVCLSTRDDMSSLSETTMAAKNADGYQYDAIVVLGASVLPTGELSDILQSRVDAAIEMYKAGAAPVIIMSGNGESPDYDEPRQMKEYAISQGVPSDAIYCDKAGLHTYDTMWRVANVYGATSAVVVTQEYHLYRSVYDAQGCGMDADGVICDNDVYDDQAWYEVREFASRIQDWWYVLSSKLPDDTTEAITL